jgi:hypothetical protein
MASGDEDIFLGALDAPDAFDTLSGQLRAPGVDVKKSILLAVSNQFIRGESFDKSSTYRTAIHHLGLAVKVDGETLVVPSDMERIEKFTLENSLSVLTEHIYSDGLFENLTSLTDEQIALHKLTELYSTRVVLREAKSVSGNSGFATVMTFQEDMLKGQHYYTLADDIVMAATKIIALQVSMNRLDPVVFLGRTPCLIKLAYDTLEFSYKPPSLTVCLSGTPDIEHVRADVEDPDPEKTDARKRNMFIRNLVTPEKLRYYCEYLDSIGMDTLVEHTSGIFIVDTIALGVALNSFLRILRYYFRVYKRPARSFPRVHFLAANYFMNKDKSDALSGYVRFPDPAVVHGIVPMRVPYTRLCVSLLTEAVLDSGNWLADFMVEAIPFYAQRWRHECDEELKNGGLLHRRYYALLLAPGSVFMNAIRIWTRVIGLIEAERALKKSMLLRTGFCMGCGEEFSSASSPSVNSFICSPACQTRYENL